MSWKWSNVPIPEAYVLGLIIGTIVQIFFAKPILKAPIYGHAIGWPLILVGSGICAWSVIEAREMTIANPNRLLQSGPYRLSRNPMYVGWALIYLGISFAANSVWIASLFPIIFIYVHFVDIRKEELYLAEQFGDEYSRYRKQVGRYF